MLFRYRAVDTKGRTKRGDMVASNLVDLEMRLGRLELLLIEAKPLTKRRSSLPWSKPVKRRDLINFCFYLEQLIGSGVPLLEGLADLRDSADNPKFKEVIAMLIQDIEGGRSLSQSMSEHPEVFDHVFINLVAAGEASGALTEVMKKLSDTLKWQDEIVAQTKKVIMYPAFVGTVIFGVITFLMVFLVPQLAGFITSIQKELPLQTKILIAVSDFFVGYWWTFLAVPLSAVGLLMLARRFDPRVPYWIDKAKLRVVVIGPIYSKIVLARFANAFSQMFGSGITVLESLKICEGVVGNLIVANALANVRREIAEGKGITESFTSTQLFPPLVLRMIRVGEQTGGVDVALNNVSYFYDRDVRDSIERMQAMIEPAMTTILGILLALIMTAVLGPIYDMITKMGA